MVDMIIDVADMGSTQRNLTPLERRAYGDGNSHPTPGFGTTTYGGLGLAAAGMGASSKG